MEDKAKKTSEHEAITSARRRTGLDQLQGWVERAQNGDEEALAKIRQMLNEVPHLAQYFGDLARLGERSFIKRLYGDDLLVQEALPPQLKGMREELAGPDPSPLERLLAERIVACWLQLQHADLTYGRNVDYMTMEQIDYHQRRLDRLQKRYLSAIKTLAQIRKLGPAVQINIAEKQINTAG